MERSNRSRKTYNGPEALNRSRKNLQLSTFLAPVVFLSKSGVGGCRETAELEQVGSGSSSLISYSSSKSSSSPTSVGSSMVKVVTPSVPAFFGSSTSG